jgi:hypothetical protein
VTVTILRPGDIVSTIPAGFVKVSRWRDARATTTSAREQQGLSGARCAPSDEE